jgi:hypothetical protein
MKGLTWDEDSEGLYNHKTERVFRSKWSSMDEATILLGDKDIRVVPPIECFHEKVAVANPPSSSEVIIISSEESESRSKHDQ